MSAAPTATVSRIVTYLRILTDLEESGIKRTSSDLLAEEARVSAFQVRKDLSHFGRFGTRGAGYSVLTLRRELRGILGLTRPWNVAIMGMGRLGQALADYPNFGQYAFELKASFDSDPAKVGRHIGDVEVYAVDEIEERVAHSAIDIAFLTVPAQVAQEAAERLVSAGIRGILNFAPTVINVPSGVFVEPVDFVAGLKRLAYYLQGGPARERVGS